MDSKVKMLEAEINSLSPNPWNSNVVSPENERKLEESFKRFGCYKPIVVRELETGALQILGGEHRWRTAKSLGYKKVPIVNVGRISDDKAKEIGLADNGRYGEDDAIQLSALLNTLGTLEDISSFLPYTENDLTDIFKSGEVDFSELDIPDSKEEIDLPIASAIQTHQVMRFKVPLEDSSKVQRLIESVMKRQGFTEDDSMTNAGNALVHILKSEFK